MALSDRERQELEAELAALRAIEDESSNQEPQEDVSESVPELTGEGTLIDAMGLPISEEQAQNVSANLGQQRTAKDRAKEQLPLDPRFNPEDPSREESRRLGALENLPFTKDVEAGVTAAIDTFMDEDYSIQEFKERYNVELAEINEEIDRAEKKYPVDFHSAGFLATLGATKGFKGLKNVAFGAASTFSRSEERELEDAVMGGALGGIGEVLGLGAQKAVTGARDTVSKILGGSAAKKAGKFPQALTVKSKSKMIDHLDKHYIKHTPKSMDKATKEFGRDILNENIFKAGDEADDIFKKVVRKKSAIGRELDSVAKKLDVQAGNKPVDDGLSILRSIKSSILDALDDKMATTRQKKAYEKMLKELEEELLTPLPDGGAVGKQLSISELIDYKRRVAKTSADFASKQERVSSVGAIVKKEYKKVVGFLNSRIDDHIDKLVTKNKDDSASMAYRKLNRRFANLTTMEDILDTTRRLQEPRTTPLGQLAQLFMGNKVPAVHVGMDALMQNPKTPIYMISGLKTLSDFSRANPNNAAVKSLVRALTTKEFSEAYAEDRLQVAMGVASLQTKPLKRNLDEIKARANTISTVLRDMDEELADIFNTALEDGDDEALLQISDTFLKLPGAHKYVEPGRGIDGKVQNEEDKAAIEAELETMDISYPQQLQHKKALREQGIIPQIKPEPDRFLEYRKRDKDKPRF